MAFATTQVRGSTMGEKKVLTGNWSGAVGDAAGTIVVATAKLYDVDVRDFDSAGPQERPHVTYSTSGRNTTLSIHNYKDVTDGRFTIIYA